MDAKITGIVAYIPVIGLAAAIVMGDKEGAKHHINQSITLHILGALVGVVKRLFLIRLLGGPLGLVLAVLWLIGIFSAIADKEFNIPIIGDIHYLK